MCKAERSAFHDSGRPSVKELNANSWFFVLLIAENAGSGRKAQSGFSETLLQSCRSSGWMVSLAIGLKRTAEGCRLSRSSLQSFPMCGKKGARIDFRVVRRGSPKRADLQILTVDSYV